jgi:phosphomannomutase/phosphoglucomutase
MNQSIFREYDIRGIINVEWTVEEAYDIGRGIFSYMLYNNPSTYRVAIGMDGRVHSQGIKEKLMQAAHDSGLDVLDVGLCPTPVLYSVLHTTEVTSGLMITASHNPGEYNGIKICANKKIIWGQEIKKIATLIQERRFYKPVLTRMLSTKTYDAKAAYIALMKKEFSSLRGLSFPVIFDCGNGAAGSVFPDLIKAMEFKETELLFEAVDGTFPHHEADPTVKKNMTVLIEAILQSNGKKIGIGFDGDVDRMGLIDEKGNLIPGDQLLALFARFINWQEHEKLIICDIKCSQGLSESLNEQNITVTMVPSGHSIIKDAMSRHDAWLAGELSCHFFFADRYFGYDDGMYAAFRVLEIMQTTGKKLTELLAFFPVKVATTEIRIPCHEQDKFRVLAAVKEKFGARSDVSMINVDGIRIQASYGWGLMRASNTQSDFCFRFESDTLDGLHAIQQDFLTVLDPLMNTKKLKEYFE